MSQEKPAATRSEARVTKEEVITALEIAVNDGEALQISR